MKAVDVKASIEKDSPKSVFSGESLKKHTVTRIPSGIFTFDMLTGGGIPAGRMSMFRGKKSSSKTTTALRVCGEFQRLNKNMSVVFIDFEGTFDWPWARHFLYDPMRFHMVQPSYGEQGVDWMKKYYMADDVGLVVVDSIGGMVSTAEAESDAGDSFVALQAKLVNRMLRHYLPIKTDLQKEGRILTLLLINQERVRIGGMKFQPTAYGPGGEMKEFTASMEVRFYAKEYKKKGSLPIKLVNTFTVEKNKVGLPKRSGEFTTYLVDLDGHKTGEPEESKVIVEYAKRVGIITKDSKGWYFGKDKFANLTALTSHFDSDPKTLAVLKKKTLDVCLADVMAGEESGEETDEKDM